MEFGQEWRQLIADRGGSPAAPLYAPGRTMLDQIGWKAAKVPAERPSARLICWSLLVSLPVYA